MFRVPVENSRAKGRAGFKLAPVSGAASKTSKIIVGAITKRRAYLYTPFPPRKARPAIKKKVAVPSITNPCSALTPFESHRCAQSVSALPKMKNKIAEAAMPPRKLGNPVEDCVFPFKAAIQRQRKRHGG